MPTSTNPVVSVTGVFSWGSSWPSETAAVSADGTWTAGAAAPTGTGAWNTETDPTGTASAAWGAFTGGASVNGVMGGKVVALVVGVIGVVVAL